MNEQIRLPVQEWLGYDPERGDIHGYSFDQMREFTKEIIEECIRICESGNATQMTSNGAANAIRQRFAYG
jgi:hypothetical protein